VRATREERAAATRRPRSKPDPNLPPFSSFLERDAAREVKERKRRRTLLISLGVHVVAVLALLFVSFWNVDELFGPSVKVRVYPAAKAPLSARPAADPLTLPLSPPPVLAAPVKAR
jgi:hypothetical protein